MAWQVEWMHAARAQLLAIPSRADAERIDAAVLRFASNDGGELERRAEPSRPYLRIQGYKIRLLLEPAERTVTVLYIWPTA